MSKTKQISYSRALSELEKIIAEIESEDTDLDVLSEKVKRAASLIKLCRAKLRSTEEEVKKALSEMEEKPGEEGATGEEVDGY
ncbi:MAG: exodeoxyribonuclease VII small subunit [Nitrospiraceae bacterium]|nr:exodeoxyribonuclease VII small subunit [Nitrospiraceae bacterium]